MKRRRVHNEPRVSLALCVRASSSSTSSYRPRATYARITPKEKNQRRGEKKRPVTNRSVRQSRTTRRRRRGSLIHKLYCYKSTGRVEGWPWDCYGCRLFAQTTQCDIMYATTVGIKHTIIRTTDLDSSWFNFYRVIKNYSVCLFVCSFFLPSDDKLLNNIRRNVRENGTSTIKSRDDGIGFFISVVWSKNIWNHVCAGNKPTEMKQTSNKNRDITNSIVT